MIDVSYFSQNGNRFPIQVTVVNYYFRNVQVQDRLINKAAVCMPNDYDLAISAP